MAAHRGERELVASIERAPGSRHLPRVTAVVRDLGVRWKGLLEVCPELAELKTRIAAELGRRA
jgi:hypothetical protein